MNARKDDLGRLIYPARGKPPQVPEDYQRDPGNPYIMIPILPPCVHRLEMEIGCCGRKYTSHVCQKELPLGLAECKVCPERTASLPDTLPPNTEHPQEHHV